MNLNKFISAISRSKIHGGASVTLPVSTAEFEVEMLDIAEYENLLDSSGVYDVSCDFIANDIVHNCRFKIRSEDMKFDLSF